MGSCPCSSHDSSSCSLQTSQISITFEQTRLSATGFLSKWRVLITLLKQMFHLLSLNIYQSCRIAEFCRWATPVLMTSAMAILIKNRNRNPGNVSTHRFEHQTVFNHSNTPAYFSMSLLIPDITYNICRWLFVSDLKKIGRLTQKSNNYDHILLTFPILHLLIHFMLHLIILPIESVFLDKTTHMKNPL